MSKKSDLNKMVSSVLNKDGKGFRDAFNDIAMEKIQTAVDNRTTEVAKDIIASETVVSDDVQKEDTENKLSELHDALNKDNQTIKG